MGTELDDDSYQETCMDFITKGLADTEEDVNVLMSYLLCLRRTYGDQMAISMMHPLYGRLVHGLDIVDDYMLPKLMWMLCQYGRKYMDNYLEERNKLIERLMDKIY